MYSSRILFSSTVILRTIIFNDGAGSQFWLLLVSFYSFVGKLQEIIGRQKTNSE
jgi:hypothetical protein